MDRVIIDARQWQAFFDLETGKRLEEDGSPAERMVRETMANHPYPGDVERQSNRWVTETALDLIDRYRPELVCLSYAQQYFADLYVPMNGDRRKEMVRAVFDEVDRFLQTSGFVPIIVGTGDMTAPRGTVDISGLEGLAITNFWSTRYTGLHYVTDADMKTIRHLDHIEMIVERDEYIGLFEREPKNRRRMPEYLLITEPGYTCKVGGTPLRKFSRIPKPTYRIPVATPLGCVESILDIRKLVASRLGAEKIALIVVEGVGAEEMPMAFQLCKNNREWYTYEPGEGQYLTLTTGAHQALAYPAGYRLYEEDGEEKQYPFSGYLTHRPENTIGDVFEGRSIAVGNRSMFTHMVYGADISIECFARNLYNQGCMAVIREKCASDEPERQFGCKQNLPVPR